MTKEIVSGIVVLNADDGAYITNGDAYSTKVYLGKNANEANWRDATAEEYAEWKRQQEVPAPTDDEALTRYANELTGGNAETLQEATETLIKIIKED